MRRLLGMAGLLGAVIPRSVMAQGDMPSITGPIIYELPRVTIEISRSWTTGVFVALTPIASEEVGRDAPGQVGLMVHPDSVLRWVNTVNQFLHRAPRTPAEGIQWVPPISGTSRSAGKLMAGLETPVKETASRVWLAAGNEGTSWRVEVQETELDSLLALLVSAAASAGWNETAVAVPVSVDTVDEPIVMLQYPPVPDVGVAGHVRARFVVDTTGRVDPKSIRFVTVTDDRLRMPARTVLLLARFQPAKIRGRPVRQAAVQTITFH